jgi:hypothetical protein
VPPANTDDMGDSYRPLASYDVGLAGIVEVTPTSDPDPLTPTPIPLAAIHGNIHG